MNADRRVPTAADVERWGRWWWFTYDADCPMILGLSASRHTDRAVVPLYGYQEAGRLNGTWLGPVNPEPLPWPGRSE